MKLEMCDLVADEEWYCVLVPGFGFEWVDACHVSSRRDWIPEGPLVSSLRKLDVPPTFPAEDALLLLSVLGNSVETLGLRKDSANARILDKLPVCCPNLKSLTLGAQAEPFTEKSLKRFFLNDAVTLETLVVEWDMCNAPVLLKILTQWKDKPAVKRLKNLHISRVPSASSCSAADMAALYAMLQANRSPEQLYMFMDELSATWDIRTPGVALEARNGEILHRNERLAERLAFLSIMKSRRDENYESALRQVDVAVVSVIFEFAEPPVRRIVHLSPTRGPDPIDW